MVALCPPRCPRRSPTPSGRRPSIGSWSSARQLVMARGLDVTMDEIAEEAGRQPAHALSHLRPRASGSSPSAGGGHPDVRRAAAVLRGRRGGRGCSDLCQAAHQMQARYGPGYWELTSRSDLAPEIAAVERRRRTRRREPWLASPASSGERRAATAIRRRRSSPRSAPTSVARFTAAVTNDVGHPWKVAAELADAAIAAQLDVLIRCT